MSDKRGQGRSDIVQSSSLIEVFMILLMRPLTASTSVSPLSPPRPPTRPVSPSSRSEDFLASHVIRVPGGVKDGSNFRENRGKAKQYSTANGRILVIKDAFAQLLGDAIYYPDSFDAQPWLIYYISRPLVGTYESIPIIAATISGSPTKEAAALQDGANGVNGTSASSSAMPRKTEIKSFGDLLNHFPMIARQMQPGLKRLFEEFGKEFEKPLPSVPNRPSRSSSLNSLRRASVSSTESLPTSLQSTISHGPNDIHASLDVDEEEDLMRRSLETAVTAAIDLFQMVDKQQLSLLGATTDLTGPLVERMIERYITEQVHHTILFPRLCSIRRFDDLELEARIRQMVDVDISQVGITIGNGQKGKRELAIRLSKGAEIFKKMGVAGGPQEMVEILLSTQKHITMPDKPADTSSLRLDANGKSDSEKEDPMLTINADTLVSLLLIVVIRSPVRHLQARLSYMRHFIFIDDVESGEMGYALSTFEAVISYLAKDAGGLRKSSRRNRKLWEATINGDIAEMQSVLEPDRSLDSEEHQPNEDESILARHVRYNNSDTDLLSIGGTTLNGDYHRHERRHSSSHSERRLQAGPLAHIFPFQRAPSPPTAERPKAKKRVSMDTRSTSSSSMFSFRSRTNTIDSHNSGIEGDTSIERLTQTHSPEGESVLMMAVEKSQDKALHYLLSLSQYYSPDAVLEDCSNNGTTLLSAAIQLSHAKTTDLILDFVLDNSPSEKVVKEYIVIQDSSGRCAAHYLFNQPRLISRIGHLVPWRLKDKNGQTPLFALCRSYDHDEYRWMINAAINSATDAQGDGQKLHLDEHIDAKGNTLLHIINDPAIAIRLLYQDTDVNAPNDKHFTPLMVASKYGRTELVRQLFQDARVDPSVKDVRGLTAVELAKDDDVRNRIDDLVLLQSEPTSDGRITTVVRSFFVEDGTVRLVLKSGAPNDNSTITVTTCRRSLVDFENLAKWLAQEHPASWLPSIANLPSPFLIPSRPSRAILRDIQIRLDSFLKLLLTHSTFSTHEMVWEFFLVPDMEPSLLQERSSRKSEIRAEHVRDEYSPVRDVREVELFVQYARESVRSVHHSTKSILRRTTKLRTASTDLTDAASISSQAVQSLIFLPQEHLKAFEKYTKTLLQSDASPMTSFYYNMLAISSTTTAVLTALNRPSTLISQMSTTQKAIDRHSLSFRRSDRWPLGLLDDARHRIQRDAAEKMDKSLNELDGLGRELRYTQQVVAGELAAWQEQRVAMGRKACRELALKMVVTERARLESMRRALRGLGLGEGRPERGRRRERSERVVAKQSGQVVAQANGSAP
ncbi:uncharacterized protein BDZ99DRAFT_496396 [Mytilinidion resinicola]|uniref:VPS9 domain-containing protein n=1 Tax=Mytilinidion resinicola TaxID=574789 RepID=A0A6A6YX63_9PEZI|nr:uncharacterized protein BDZ99DRAFT_496396 [Mytilinidion resinicola]KAF2813391.1 hypothetical protein BDZ99DRAFT_496396 [Mytilinidion resinicola]